jgi:hypothetical protein
VIIQPLAGRLWHRPGYKQIFGGSKEERSQRYNYNFTFNCIPLLAPMAKGGEVSRILNLES